MAVLSLDQGSKTAEIIALGTLASGTYIVSAALDLTDNIPLDLNIEVLATPGGTPTGNKQMMLFAKISLDNSVFTSGPESGTSATNEEDLYFIGALPCNDTSAHRKIFSLRDANVPVSRYLKLVLKNDLGVALSSGSVYAAIIEGEVA